MTKDTLQTMLRASMKAGNKFETAMIRMALSEVQRKEGSLGKDLTEKQVADCIKSLVGAADTILATNHVPEFKLEEARAEKAFYTKLLPVEVTISDEDLTKLIQDKMSELGISQKNQMGSLMGAIKNLPGVDAAKASGIARNLLK